MSEQSSGKKIAKGLMWKLLERVGAYGVQFVLQIVLAILISPSDYGALTVMMVFINLSNVFIQNGFSTALVQNKKTYERDYSSVFWVSLGISCVVYACLFLAAPLIAGYYKIDNFETPFRVLALMLFPGALNSVQNAIITREMNFRKAFLGNLIGLIVSGAVGIAVAVMGGGIWALVSQTLLNVVISSIVFLIIVAWKPRFEFDRSRIGILFSFGWKLLISSLVETLWADIQSLVIGKKYDTETLGYYNRGKQFPQFIANTLSSSIQSVMLPALSELQSDKDKLKALMRTGLSMSAYIIFPVMAGLAGVGMPFVHVLLTEKWLPCVIYIQLYSFIFAFAPVNMANLQAINAIGRSDIYLKLEMIKKVIGIAALVIAVVCFESPVAIAMSSVIISIPCLIINAWPNKKLIGYSFTDQAKDILPSFILSLAMFGIVFLMGNLPLAKVLVLGMQIIVGIVFYVCASALFKVEPFVVLLTLLRKALAKRKK